MLAYLKQSWFWLGVWIFYYLRYTDYAGIGLIESVMIFTVTVGEIPTGAVADLLGKKNTLKIAFLLETIGSFLLASATSFSFILVAIVIGTIGGTLYSGAYEALIYDSLKENGKESIFDKVISNVNSIGLVAIAFAGLVSGYLYGVDPRMPYVMVGIATLVALVLTFFLVEPKIDSEKFSLSSFLAQNKKGVVELGNIIKSYWLAPILVSVSALCVISDEMLESILSIEFGFTERTIGPFFAVLFLIAAAASQLTPYIRKFLGERKAIIIISLLIAITYLLSPYVGLVVGAIVLTMRESLARNFQNITNVYINSKTESKNRATVLSSYNMLKNLPYVFSAFWLGKLMDIYSARIFSFWLGVIIVIIVISLFSVNSFQKDRVKSL